MGVEWLASQLKFPSSRVKPQRGGLPRCSNALRSGGIMVTFISSSKVGGTVDQTRAHIFNDPGTIKGGPERGGGHTYSRRPPSWATRRGCLKGTSEPSFVCTWILEGLCLGHVQGGRRQGYKCITDGQPGRAHPRVFACCFNARLYP